MRDMSHMGRPHSIEDYATVGLKKKSRSIRISIHGIPQHIPDEEIHQWIKEHARNPSKIERATVNARFTRDSSFKKLFNGNRFCYAEEITDPIVRFSTYPVPNPANTEELIDVDLTVYHEDQIVNCKLCKMLDHTFTECPRQGKKGPTCFRCNQQGHIQRDCRANRPVVATGSDAPETRSVYQEEGQAVASGDADDELNDSNEEGAQDRHADADGSPDDTVRNVAPEALKLVEEIIDHSMQPPEQTAKSPELQQKITGFLLAAKEQSRHIKKSVKTAAGRASSRNCQRLKDDGHQRTHSVSVI